MKQRNIDGSIKRFKLTLVSCYCRGQREARFFNLPVDENGQVKVARTFWEENFDIIKEAGRGVTYTLS